MARVLFMHRNAENLGIEYMSAMLKAHGHETALLFDPGAGDVEYPILKRFNFFSYKQLDQMIAFFKPDVVLFSVMSSLFPWASKYASYMKNKGIPVGMGGPHPTLAPGYVIQKLFVDFVCVGEGEYAILEIANRIDRLGRLDFKGIQNIWYKEYGEGRQNGKVIVNQKRQLIQDLDELPFPDKDLFYRYGVFSRRYYIMTSRGCPYSCTYCINHRLKDIYKGLGHYLRRRSPRNVVAELVWAQKKYHYKEVYFYDDIFSFDANWLSGFKKELAQVNLNIKYKCLVHPQTITPEISDLLKSTGCIDVDMGVESGSPRVRAEVYHRHMSNKRILHAAQLLKQRGIRVSTLNIINSPTENPEDMIETFHLNHAIRPAGVTVKILYPFIHTRIYDMCRDEGLLDEETIRRVSEGGESYVHRSILKHPHGKIGYQISVFLPLFVRLQKRFSKYLLKMPAPKLFRVLLIPLNTSLHNTIVKINEFIFMTIRSRIFYHHLQKISKGHRNSADKLTSICH